MNTNPTDRTNRSPEPRNCECVYWARTYSNTSDKKELLRHHPNCQHRYHPTVNPALKGSSQLQKHLQVEFLTWWRQLTPTAQRIAQTHYQQNPHQTALQILHTISYKNTELLKKLTKGLRKEHRLQTVLYCLKSTGVINP